MGSRSILRSLRFTVLYTGSTTFAAPPFAVLSFTRLRATFCAPAAGLPLPRTHSRLDAPYRLSTTDASAAAFLCGCMPRARAAHLVPLTLSVRHFTHRLHYTFVYFSFTYFSRTAWLRVHTRLRLHHRARYCTGRGFTRALFLFSHCRALVFTPFHILRFVATFVAFSFRFTTPAVYAFARLLRLISAHATCAHTHCLPTRAFHHCAPARIHYAFIYAVLHIVVPATGLALPPLQDTRLVSLFTVYRYKTISVAHTAFTRFPFRTIHRSLHTGCLSLRTAPVYTFGSFLLLHAVRVLGLPLPFTFSRFTFLHAPHATARPPRALPNISHTFTHHFHWLHILLVSPFVHTTFSPAHTRTRAGFLDVFSSCRTPPVSSHRFVTRTVYRFPLVFSLSLVCWFHALLVLRWFATGFCAVGRLFSFTRFTAAFLHGLHALRLVWLRSFAAPTGFLSSASFTPTRAHLAATPHAVQPLRCVAFTHLVFSTGLVLDWFTPPHHYAHLLHFTAYCHYCGFYVHRVCTRLPFSLSYTLLSHVRHLFAIFCRCTHSFSRLHRCRLPFACVSHAVAFVQDTFSRTPKFTRLHATFHVYFLLSRLDMHGLLFTSVTPHELRLPFAWFTFLSAAAAHLCTTFTTVVPHRFSPPLRAVHARATAGSFAVAPAHTTNVSHQAFWFGFCTTPGRTLSVGYLGLNTSSFGFACGRTAHYYWFLDAVYSCHFPLRRTYVLVYVTTTRATLHFTRYSFAGLLMPGHFGSSVYYVLVLLLPFPHSPLRCWFTHLTGSVCGFTWFPYHAFSLHHWFTLFTFLLHACTLRFSLPLLPVSLRVWTLFLFCPGYVAFRLDACHFHTCGCRCIYHHRVWLLPHAYHGWDRTLPTVYWFHLRSRLPGFLPLPSTRTTVPHLRFGRYFPLLRLAFLLFSRYTLARFPKHRTARFAHAPFYFIGLRVAGSYIL